MATTTTTTVSTTTTTTTTTEPLVLQYTLPSSNGNNNSKNSTVNGRIFLYGCQDAQNIVLFCPGVPDDCLSSFEGIALELVSKNGNILCGLICLPGFDYYNTDTCTSLQEHCYNVNGYTMGDWIFTVNEAYTVLTKYASHPSPQYIGIFHDFGVVAGAMFTNRHFTNYCNSLTSDATTTNTAVIVPYAFHKIVYLDVLPTPHSEYKIVNEYNIYKTCVELSYRSCNAILWLLYRYVPTYVSQNIIVPVIGTLFFSSLSICNLFPLCNKNDFTIMNHRLTKTKHMNYYRFASMCYPYYLFIKSIIKNTLWNDWYEFHLPKHDTIVLQSNSNSTNSKNSNVKVDVLPPPILYMYGLDKNINFHDTTWLYYFIQQYIPNVVKSKVITIQNSGHWFYMHNVTTTCNYFFDFIHS